MIEKMEFDQQKHLRAISKKGGLARVRKHGNPGTKEGRSLGGRNSLKTHNILKTGFVVLREINLPMESEQLAELCGIIMGDGHVNNYQISMTTNLRTDYKHALFVQKLFKSCFSTPVSIRKRYNKNVVIVVLSSKVAADFLVKKGLVRGHKINADMRIPAWIKKNKAYSKAFIRGLFDTDGCVYLDKHQIKGKLYKYIGWTITSNAGTFLLDVTNLMEQLGFPVTKRPSQNSVFLRRREEVKRYFAEIGTSNSKHKARYRQFLE